VVSTREQIRERRRHLMADIYTAHYFDAMMMDTGDVLIRAFRYKESNGCTNTYRPDYTVSEAQYVADWLNERLTWSDMIRFETMLALHRAAISALVQAANDIERCMMSADPAKAAAQANSIIQPALDAIPLPDGYRAQADFAKGHFVGSFYGVDAADLFVVTRSC
jgi:hypothetical protein